MTATTTTPANVLTEVENYDLNVLVFFRGDWCPFCQSYLRELNGDFRSKIEAQGGRLVAITSQSDEAAQGAKEAWGLDFDVISDPSTDLAQQFNVNVTPKAESPLAEHPTEYPNGMTQTGVIILDRNGEQIYHWAIDPTEVNLFGASDRPLTDEVWAAIDAQRNGTETVATDGRRLDPQFLADHYPEQFAHFEAWVASQNA
jgi:peroxiredoxin